MNLLGSGAPALQPFAIWSATVPEGVAARQRSAIAGTGRACWPATRRPASRRTFPTSVSYARRRGPQRQPAPHVRVRPARPLRDRRGAAAARRRSTRSTARSTFPNIVFERDSFNALSGAIGFKANLFERLLLDVNLLFKLDEHGLRDKVTPLIGFEYSFELAGSGARCHELVGTMRRMTLHDSHCHFFSSRFFEALGREKYGADASARPRIGSPASSGGRRRATPRGAGRSLGRGARSPSRLARASLIASVPGDEESVAVGAGAPSGSIRRLLRAERRGARRASSARTARSRELGLRCVCLFPGAASLPAGRRTGAQAVRGRRRVIAARSSCTAASSRSKRASVWACARALDLRLRRSAGAGDDRRALSDTCR